MFESFFPKPKLLLLTTILWTVLCIAIWYAFGQSIGAGLGFHFRANGGTVIGLGHFITPEFLWFDLYFFIITSIFGMFWYFYSPHPWQRWSVWGTAFIIFLAYVVVQVSVVINAWFGPFYDAVQKALAGKGQVSAKTLYYELFIFCEIVFPYIVFMIGKSFFLSHYAFRWRNAMNDYYTQRWERVRHIEGASQRIQEDTMRFASIMEDLGVNLVDSVMTLIAFLPVLAKLSVHMSYLPLVGKIPYSLIWASLVWSAIGTTILLFAGIKLPGLNFKNQRVEAALRKELVYGEDDEGRAKPVSVVQLFNNVRRNYFRIYFHYTYFNLVRYLYLQADNVFGYIILIPTIALGKITLGIMNQILRAFTQVANSFQFLVNSWTVIIELLSIHKRLQAFEALFKDRPLPKLDQDFMNHNLHEQGKDDAN